MESLAQGAVLNTCGDECVYYSYNWTFDGSERDSFQYQIEDQYGALSNKVWILMINEEFSGIEEFNLSSLSIYPNPTKNSFKIIKTDDSFPIDGKTISVGYCFS